MDVLIAGAGVGGLALAAGLTADGHTVRVLERAPAPRTDGAAVTIFCNGAKAAHELGVPLDGLGGPVRTLTFTLPDGTVFGRTDLTVMRRRTGFGVATVPRHRLLARLAAPLSPGGAISYGVEVTGVAPDANGVTVSTADGATHRADVLVGADGYRSAVRRAVLGDEPARHNGWISWQGLTVALPEIAGSPHARCVVGPAGLCGLMPAGDGLLQWWFDTPDAPESEPTLEWLRGRFAAYAGPVAALLDGLTEADVQRYPHVRHAVPDRWGAERTTLVGDAAHAFPPSQAQGANQALEDAWVLRRRIALPDGLRRYERERIPRVRRISRLAASEVTNRPPSPLGRLAGRLAGPRLGGLAYLAMLRRCSNVLGDR
ncbi:monooxygenase [Virgisporangium aliadipatigenens]|uniref:Monooxygenase n=1 Tax=Virgisporangium aliadipatigenens TaxID=741659 RepID=A0A8J4DNN7_9ACTN|nr:NAD(P)/FAD-dependent oxidoreductase [Virgisporangium aliadipatigenens]GIJ45085.1 monooxygenase [Virgisporangium aliadipatigenens]